MSYVPEGPIYAPDHSKSYSAVTAPTFPFNYDVLNRELDINIWKCIYKCTSSWYLKEKDGKDMVIDDAERQAENKDETMKEQPPVKEEKTNSSENLLGMWHRQMFNRFCMLFDG